LLAEETIADPDFDPGPESSEYRWILDPLDGTINYAHGSPHFCVSLALEYRGKLLSCGIYAPCYDEYYSAQAGAGAFLNGKSLRCSATEDPVEALAAFGFPPSPINPATPDYQAFMAALGEFQAMRRTGSTALNLAYVAAGHFDACWTYAANAWDVAAGVLLIQEAGGIVSGPGGAPFDINRHGTLAAGTAKLHQKIVDFMDAAGTGAIQE